MQLNIGTRTNLSDVWLIPLISSRVQTGIFGEGFNNTSNGEIGSSVSPLRVTKIIQNNYKIYFRLKSILKCPLSEAKLPHALLKPIF